MTVWASILKWLVVLCQRIILFSLCMRSIRNITIKDLSGNFIATSLLPTKNIGDTKTVSCFLQKMKYQPAVGNLHVRHPLSPNLWI